jgi:hypothetical protein
MEIRFTDEAGVALAEACLDGQQDFPYASFAWDLAPTRASLGAQTYEAFCTILRVNAGFSLDLPTCTFDAAVGNERVSRFPSQFMFLHVSSLIVLNRP